MSTPKQEKKVSPPRSFGWMAEYSDENDLLDACRKVRDSGYTRTDAFAPFPIHGIDEALGIKPTILPWITLCCGLTGLTGALLMEYWMNAVSYPYIISGKPFFSLPAFIPVMFECTILFSAFSTVIGMVLLNGLPKFSNPVFTNPRFDRATDDRFFLWVDSRDRYFNGDKVKSLLESTSPLSFDVVREDESSDHVPSGLWKTAAAVVLIGLIPGSAVLRMRASQSEDPRWHVFFDMDFQPKKKAQQTSTLFADNRASRPPVAGTVARGDLGSSDPYELGYTPVPLALDASPTSVRMVSLTAADDAQAAKPVEGQPPTPAKSEAAGKAETPAVPTEAAAAKKDEPAKSEETKPAATAPAAAPSAAAAPAQAGPAGAPAAEELPWVSEFPVPETDEKMMALGKLKFTTNCSVCHGAVGDGVSLVSNRATELAQGYWVQPTSLHEPRVQVQPVGKIFHTITNGRGKMGAYGNVLSAKERWAIVLYVRALQLSRDAKLEDVPEPQRAKLTAATPTAATPAAK
ncbi:MAG: DUF3341 domain-containing protein [Pirellulaceae bacterium]|nr:DUF3341 domain-containing protein [Pirellulaceae bacterium]